MSVWADRLEGYGADLASLFSFDDDSPALLPYASLTNARRNGSPVLDMIGAVYEWQEEPLLFLVDADDISGDVDIHKLRRILAMRGDAPYLGVAAAGRLDVYSVALDRKTPLQARVALGNILETNRNILPNLANRRPQAARTRQGWISNVVLKLLTDAIDGLITQDGVRHDDAISLVGRALFARFLGDRDLLPTALAGPHASAGLFDGAAVAEATCDWLDRTFNGDLLPLSAGIFRNLPTNAFHRLGNIMRRAPDGQLYLGWEERWDQLDFAHIPVGVLSQAYELYLRSHAPARQRREGGYYTPRPIADLLVRAAFRALDRDGECASARVLDPAAGAGVFLLTAFRELVAARWRADGKRPNTKRLREILYSQVTGFDINEAALRFAALALYLISIELDPEPRPVDKLRFDDLRGTVLHRFSSEDDAPGETLGSLGSLVGDEHRARYDVVIGNPPWATGTKLKNWSVVRQIVARIASERAGVPIAPSLPNEVLDLPFVWRAMEWARPGGQIAFALHARLLFQQGDGMAGARQTIFETLDVRSVINGVELRQTKVWPEISAPFCLLFARNCTPAAGAGFRLLNPRLESDLNAAGAMRIDPGASETVATREMVETAEILKILFRGSRADLGLVERVRAKGFPTLETFWREAVGVSDRGRMAGVGRGYQTVKPSSRVREMGDGKPGADARYLHGLPDITIGSLDDFLIDTPSLPLFQHDRLHDPRDPRLFKGPLAVIHKSPSAERGRVRASVSDAAVAYNENFYGYSPGALDDGGVLARYVALVLGSKFALWYALITSGEFGFERDVIEKAAFDRMPLPDFRSLDSAQRKTIATLFEGIRHETLGWSDVDDWIFALYGLGPSDLQTVSDTLAFNLPFATSKMEAQRRPGKDALAQFSALLRDELAPWTKRFGTPLSVDTVPQNTVSPWEGIALRTTSDRAEDRLGRDWEGLLQAADATAASEILVDDGKGLILIGRLAQMRYWSPSQARQLAQHLVWSHLEFLKGPRSE